MNTMKFLAALTLGSALAISSAEALSRADYSKVLPLPASIEIPGEGMFRFQPSSRICYPAENKDLENNARMLAEYLRELTGYEPEITSGEHRDGDIILSLELPQHPDFFRYSGRGILRDTDAPQISGRRWPERWRSTLPGRRNPRCAPFFLPRRSS